VLRQLLRLHQTPPLEVHHHRNKTVGPVHGENYGEDRGPIKSLISKLPTGHRLSRSKDRRDSFESN
jgi:hypothetical protein